MDRERIIQVFFFGFLALMAYELYALLDPFLMPIAWAILLAFMVHPVQLELRKYVKNRTLTAVIITIVVATGVILPAIWLSERLVIEAQTLYVQANEFVKNGGVKEIDGWIQNPPYFGSLIRRFTGGRHFDLNTDVPKFFVQGAQGTSEYLIKNLTGVAKNLVSLVIDFSIVLMIFFYLLRDGEDYYKSLRELTPLHDEDKAEVYDTLTSTLSAVMRGLLLTALIQCVAIWPRPAGDRSAVLGIPRGAVGGMRAVAVRWYRHRMGPGGALSWLFQRMDHRHRARDMVRYLGRDHRQLYQAARDAPRDRIANHRVVFRTRRRPRG